MASTNDARRCKMEPGWQESRVSPNPETSSAVFRLLKSTFYARRWRSR